MPRICRRTNGEAGPGRPPRWSVDRDVPARQLAGLRVRAERDREAIVRARGAVVDDRDLVARLLRRAVGMRPRARAAPARRLATDRCRRGAGRRELRDVGALVDVREVASAELRLVDPDPRLPAGRPDDRAGARDLCAGPADGSAVERVTAVVWNPGNRAGRLMREPRHAVARSREVGRPRDVREAVVADRDLE